MKRHFNFIFSKVLQLVTNLLAKRATAGKCGTESSFKKWYIYHAILSNANKDTRTRQRLFYIIHCVARRIIMYATRARFTAFSHCKNHFSIMIRKKVMTNFIHLFWHKFLCFFRQFIGLTHAIVYFFLQFQSNFRYSFHSTFC